MQQASLICVHCGAVVRRTDKPFCVHCGKYWSSTTPETHIQQHSVSDSEQYEEDAASTYEWMNVLFPSPGSEEHEERSFENAFSSAPQVTRHEFMLKTEPMPQERKEERGDMAEEHLLSAQSSSIDEILEKLRELQNRAPHARQRRENEVELHMLPVNELLAQIQQLQTKLGNEGSSSVADNDWRGGLEGQQESSTFQRELGIYLERARKYVELLEGLPLEEAQEQGLLQQLTAIVRDLDFTQPYHVMLLAYTFASAQMVLAALLHEPFFRLPLGEHLTSVSLRIHFCGNDEEEMLRVLLPWREREVLTVPRARWGLLWSQPKEVFPTLALEDIQRVEITLRAQEHPLLAVGSVLDVVICADGALAGQMLWDEDYPEIHALLVTADYARLHSAAMQRWIEQMQYKLAQQGLPILMNREIFLLAVGVEQEGDGGEKRESRGMVPYEVSDRPQFVHSAITTPMESKQFLYYTVRALDAFYAEMGLRKVELPERLQKERDHYTQEVVALKEKPRALEVPFAIPGPGVKFMEIGLELHEYMLQFSGIPTLVSRVQQSIRKVRAYQQLVQVDNSFRKVYHLIEEICWEKLEQSDLYLTNRRLETIETAMANREQKRNLEIRTFIGRQVQLMDIAWNDARIACVEANQEGNDTRFHQVLEVCHQRSADYVRHRIQQGFFDSYIGNDARRRSYVSAVAVQQTGREVQLWHLLEKIRASLRVALEEELRNPARELAETFLSALQEKEQEQGPLDMDALFFYEQSEPFNQLQKRYYTIKQDVHAKAYAACLCVTLSELLSEKRRLTPASQSVQDLMTFVTTEKQPQAVFQQQCREKLEAVLQEMQQGMVEQTEQIILDFFCYELDTFQAYEVYDWERRKELSTEPGKFVQLLHDTEDQLVEYLRTSASYRKKLVKQLYPSEDEAPYWYHLLETLNQI